ncbi:hypothetical protein [Natrarchaeobius oligotrophus]|uniref:Type IV pilin n=1 Tax=Natrarchaeobius chitinivorans TaxID=1679083 RepID=A0A3N6MI87_NATCH|nr:hypothetical protein [Natrarchaeobius chitinivorans]RQH00855.1 hypothetical protein EA472_09510 [Natrarchaeobius chitinivorans]
MVSRGFAILLVGVLLVASLFAVAVATGSDRPVVTIENDVDDEQHVTVYTVADLDEAGYLNFEVTTADGDRRLATLDDLVWPGEYRNVTPVDDVHAQEITVGPGENVTTSVEDWSRGDVTVYVVETGENRTHTGTRTITCGSRGQEHTLSPTDAGLGSSTLCAGGFGWLIPWP